MPAGTPTARTLVDLLGRLSLPGGSRSNSPRVLSGAGRVRRATSAGSTDAARNRSPRTAG